MQAFNFTWSNQDTESSEKVTFVRKEIHYISVEKKYDGLKNKTKPFKPSLVKLHRTTSSLVFGSQGSILGWTKTVLFRNVGKGQGKEE